MCIAPIAATALQLVPASGAMLGDSLGAALEQEPAPAFEQASSALGCSCFQVCVYPDACQLPATRSLAAVAVLSQLDYLPSTSRDVVLAVNLLWNLWVLLPWCRRRWARGGQSSCRVCMQQKFWRRFRRFGKQVRCSRQGVQPRKLQRGAAGCLVFPPAHPTVRCPPSWQACRRLFLLQRCRTTGIGLLGSWCKVGWDAHVCWVLAAARACLPCCGCIFGWRATSRCRLPFRRVDKA